MSIELEQAQANMRIIATLATRIADELHTRDIDDLVFALEALCEKSLEELGASLAADTRASI